MGGNHRTVRCLIKFYARIVEPMNGLRCIANQLRQQLPLCGIVTAAECVHKVNGRRIVGLVSSLDTALCHHGVGIADPQLGDDHSLCACIVRFNGSRL